MVSPSRLEKFSVARIADSTSTLFACKHEQVFGQLACERIRSLGAPAGMQLCVFSETESRMLLVIGQTPGNIAFSWCC